MVFCYGNQYYMVYDLQTLGVIEFYNSLKYSILRTFITKNSKIVLIQEEGHINTWNLDMAAS